MRNFTEEHLHVIENVGCRCKICEGSIFKSQKRQESLDNSKKFVIIVHVEKIIILVQMVVK